MRLAKIAMYNVHGLKDKSEQLSIDDLAVKSLIYVIIPNLTVIFSNIFTVILNKNFFFRISFAFICWASYSDRK